MQDDSMDAGFAGRDDLLRSAAEASKSGSHTLKCPEEQGSSSHVAGEGVPANCVLLEETLGSRSVVTKGTCVTVLSCVPAARSPSKKYKQTIRRLQAKVAAQRKTIKRLLRQPHQAPSSTSKALGIIRPHVTEELLNFFLHMFA
ncbi:hypothetical protein HPB50_008383 [Hyalomma asiaticum]|uniref:Uncharacterized protein n=1 Tax=Hyalomma asiaticum TaxID=266040 RepID=A0ACB7SP80_HYAAI|nr:hypothetical protein HPB50_008383 [Hyalomma asiaticum]